MPSQYIYDKNIKQLANHLETFRQTYLEPLGVYECGYSYYNIKQGTYFCVSSNNPWRYEFLEQDLDLLAADFLRMGVSVIDDQNIVMQHYNKLIKSDENKRLKSTFVYKYEQGFDMLVCSTYKPLESHQQAYIYKICRTLAYSMMQRFKYKPFLLTGLRPLEAVKAKHATCDTQELDLPATFKGKSFFNHYSLTNKELEYIKFSMMSYTHVQIATMKGCTETAVRNIYMNIKRKLGNENMSVNAMMKTLKETGALESICLELAFL